MTTICSAPNARTRNDAGQSTHQWRQWRVTVGMEQAINAKPGHCKYCQEELRSTLWGGKEYCSIRCRHAANDALRKSKEAKQVRIKSRRCAECLHPFEPKPQQLYCGVACRRRSERRNRERMYLASKCKINHTSCEWLTPQIKPEKEEMTKNCVFCDNEFTPGGRNRYYCSDECKSWDDDATGMERLKAEQEAKAKTKARTARSLSDLSSGKVAAAPIRTTVRKERRLPGL